MKQALLLNDDRTQLASQTCELIRCGFSVINADSLTEALSYARLGAIDLVVMCEEINGQLTHCVALSAEQKNPDVTTIVITDRTGSDIDELFDLLPSLTTLLGSQQSIFNFGRLIVSEQSYQSQNRPQKPHVASDWMDIPMGAISMSGSLRLGEASSSQIASYDGGWPKTPFSFANLKRGLAAGTFQPAAALVA